MQLHDWELGSPVCHWLHLAIADKEVEDVGIANHQGFFDTDRPRAAYQVVGTVGISGINRPQDFVQSMSVPIGRVV